MSGVSRHQPLPPSPQMTVPSLNNSALLTPFGGEWARADQVPPALARAKGQQMPKIRSGKKREVAERVLRDAFSLFRKKALEWTRTFFLIWWNNWRDIR